MTYEIHQITRRAKGTQVTDTADVCLGTIKADTPSRAVEAYCKATGASYSRFKPGVNGEWTETFIEAREAQVDDRK